MPFAAIDHFNEAYSALQMGSKIREALTVLRLRTAAGAVCQDRFQQIQVMPAGVQILAHNDPGEPLARAPALDARLVVIHAESLFDCDGRYMCREALRQHG